MERYYTVKEIADMLQFSEKQIRNFILEGYLQSVKVKNRHRISESQLERFIQNNLTNKGDI